MSARDAATIAREGTPIAREGATKARDDASPPAGPFHEDYLPYLLARAAHEVAGRFHERLKEHELTALSWRVLAALSARDGWTIGELCAVSLAKQPTVSKMIDRLERQRLVTRAAASDDGRKVLVRLTAAGRRRIAPAIAEADAYNRALLEGLRPGEFARLKSILRELIERHGRGAATG